MNLAWLFVFEYIGIQGSIESFWNFATLEGGFRVSLLKIGYNGCNQL